MEWLDFAQGAPHNLDPALAGTDPREDAKMRRGLREPSLRERPLRRAALSWRRQPGSPLQAPHLPIGLGGNGLSGSVPAMCLLAVGSV